MTQSETIDFINSKARTKLVENDYQFNPYDAEDSNYLVEIKNRKKDYDSPFIEVPKTKINLKLAKLNNKQYLFVHQDSTGVYVFNISKINLDNVPRRIIKAPATTDFDNTKKKDKDFWILSKSLATRLEL